MIFRIFLIFLFIINKNFIILPQKEFEKFLVNKNFNVIPTYSNCAVIKFVSEKDAKLFNKFLEKKILTTLGNGTSTYRLDNSFVRIVYGTKEQIRGIRKIIDKK